ncbi:MAG: galactokinase [Phycisphaerae bacterium]
MPALLARLGGELAAFARRADGTRAPVRVARAPGRLDVMGGVADYTGSLVCEMPLARAAAVALAARDDRDVQVFSFNLLDEHKPFTARMSLDALAAASAESLGRDFAADPQRLWAAYLVGCLFLLHEQKYVDLRDPRVTGIDLALLSDVPPGAGISSSAAITVATMLALVDHFGLRDRIDGMALAALCQQVENRIAGAPCGIMDQATAALGTPGELFRLLCQPHQLLDPLPLPPGVRVVGVDTGVRHWVSGGQYGRTRAAAFMGHRLILDRMRKMGRINGKELVGDPLDGYLANLPLQDYKDFFRPYLPAVLSGAQFVAEFGATVDPVSRVETDADYAVQTATDHHVHDAERVRNFVKFIEKANALTPGTPERSKYLDMAGHLMYASHVSYTRDALLGAPEADVMVDLVRKMERTAKFYGARITGAGQGGTVAVLCAEGDRTDSGLADLMAEYTRQTGKTPTLFAGTSPGAWWTGTAVV